MIERLTSCAIKRDGVVHSGHREHWLIRNDLGDDRPDRETPGDECGFLTSEGRFLSRVDAIDIALSAKQVPGRYQFQPPERLLSSNIDWDASQ